MDTTPLPRTASQDIPAPPRNRRRLSPAPAHGLARFQPKRARPRTYGEATRSTSASTGVGLTTGKALAAGALISGGAVHRRGAAGWNESRGGRWVAELADKRFPRSAAAGKSALELL